MARVALNKYFDLNRVVRLWSNSLNEETQLIFLLCLLLHVQVGLVCSKGETPLSLSFQIYLRCNSITKSVLPAYIWPSSVLFLFSETGFMEVINKSIIKT